MILRDALEADLPAIVAIYNAAIPGRIATADTGPVAVADRLPWFREHSPDWHPFWVIELDGAVAAWLSFQSFHSRCAYRGTAEISVYVDEKFRRRGLARTLLAAALARSPQLGIDVLLALVFAHNAPSLQLFASFDFVRWGCLPGIARMDGAAYDLAILGRRL